ncbi:MAG: peptide-methionine (R)-S-oxide reductase MsrB [Parcubacteria group bacterium]
MIEKINKSSDEWKKILTPDVYAITRGNGTEPAFKNAYWNNEKEGLYKCSNCQLVLFSSEHKFDSGTGWPSFWRSYKEENVVFHTDRSQGMVRKEARCARCGSHLGHVFEDGPVPTGLRFCMNSAALIFEQDLPDEI